jgi:hypothetical protein
LATSGPAGIAAGRLWWPRRFAVQIRVAAAARLVGGDHAGCDIGLLGLRIRRLVFGLAKVPIELQSGMAEVVS